MKKKDFNSVLLESDKITIIYFGETENAEFNKISAENNNKINYRFINIIIPQGSSSFIQQFDISNDSLPCLCFYHKGRRYAQLNGESVINQDIINNYTQSISKIISQ